MQLRDNFGFQCCLCPHVVELQLYCCWYVSTEQMDVVDVKMVGVSLCQPPPLSVIHLKKDRIFRVSVFIYHNFQEALPRSKEVNPFCSKLCKTVKSGGLRCLQRSSTLIFQATISSATATFFDTWSLSITSHQRLDIERMGNCTQPVQLGHWYYGKKVWWCLFLKPQVDVTSSCCEVVKFWRGRVDTQVRVDISHDWVRWTMRMEMRWRKVDNASWRGE